MEIYNPGRIELLVDVNKNIVIFPYNYSDFPVELADGTLVDSECLPCDYPIELKYPYTVSELADKIKEGFEECGKHECYPHLDGKKTLEEKYYGIKGFKNAVKGVLHMDLGCTEILGNFVWLSMPVKRGYAYLGLHTTDLPSNAGWGDFANAVVDYINMDLSKLSSFKTFKKQLNLNG